MCLVITLIRTQTPGSKPGSPELKPTVLFDRLPSQPMAGILFGLVDVKKTLLENLLWLKSEKVDHPKTSPPNNKNMLWRSMLRD